MSRIQILQAYVYKLQKMVSAMETIRDDEGETEAAEVMAGTCEEAASMLGDAIAELQAAIARLESLA